MIIRVVIVAAALVASPLVAGAQAMAGARLTLGDAARMAAQRAPSAVAARERAIQYGARAFQQRSDLLPSLTSEAQVDGGDATFTSNSSGSFPIVTGSGRTVDTRFRLTQRVLDLPALRRWRAAISDVDAARGSALDAADAAAEEGASAYLRVLQAQGRLEARIADSALAAELLDIARQQLRAGTAIALDVTRAESQLASAVSQLITTRNERATARLELHRVLALAMDARVELADSLVPPGLADLEVPEAEAVRLALATRGDVVTVVAAAEAARRRTEAYRAERFPTVAVFGSIGSSTDGIAEDKTYGIQLSVPLFDGFRRKARVAEGQAREREAEAQFQDVRLRTEVEIRTALLDLGAARERVAAAQVQLRLANQEVAQARERFRAGVAGNADVISASLVLNQARDLVVDALTAYHAGRVGLARARGRSTWLP
jgi:outer membrane protein TolC